jgi:uncharacterized phiE125 gp8 family phage protein
MITAATQSPAHFALKLITAPAAEPLLLEEAKLHLRIDHAEEDSEINALIADSRECGESFTNRAFITQTWDYFLDAFPPHNGCCDEIIRLRKPPLISVTHIKYYDTNGDLQTLPPTEYVVDANSTPARIMPAYGKTWPTTRDSGISHAVEIRQVCGYGVSGSAVPSRVKRAMKLLIGHYYKYREQAISGTIINEIPMAVQNLLWPLRVVRFD